MFVDFIFYCISAFSPDFPRVLYSDVMSRVWAGPFDLTLLKRREPRRERRGAKSSQDGTLCVCVGGGFSLKNRG